MLQCVIAANKTRNDPADRPDTAERPLNARSVALSALLGTHPPALPGGALVALGRLFGIADGAMRTALSRMAADGEVALAEGRYRVVGSLLDRQRSQDSGRRQPPEPWRGDWHTVVALDAHRSLPERRRFRAAMVDHRFGELRPDIWMRPANLPAPAPEPGRLVTTGSVSTGRDRLAHLLWDLDAIAATAAALDRRIVRLVAALQAADPGDHGPIAPLFAAAATVVRFLRTEPLLPAAVTPRDWAPDALRHTYDDAEQQLQARLRRFFSEVDRRSGSTTDSPAGARSPSRGR